MQWISGVTTVPSEVHVAAGKVVGLGRNLVSFEESLVSAPSTGKGKARKAIDDEGERLFLLEQDVLERSYLEAE